MSFHTTRTCAIVSLCGLAACSPSLNWREVRPEASELVAMFPCKPQQLSRRITLAGSATTMRLASCTVEGTTFAVSYASVTEPLKVAAALEQLRAAAAANIGGQPGMPAPMKVVGMTPHPLAQRWTMRGHGADGKELVEQVGVFSRGLTVYQSTVVGQQLGGEVVDTFFEGLRLPT